MKHPTLTLLAACAALIVTAAVALPAQSLDWGGSLQVDAGLAAGENFTFPSGSFNQLGLSLDLHGEVQPGETLRLYGELLVSADGLPVTLTSFADLSSYATLHPAEVRLVEAYVDLYDVLLPRLDIRIGRQRIAWGPAERVGVVDFVDPNDLEDPWSYGERTASDALKVAWRAGALKVEAVYVPTFKPALLPMDPSTLMSGALAAIPFVPSSITPLPVAPTETLAAQATLAARTSITLGGIDLAATYAYGRQSLPAITSITGTGTLPDNVSLQVSVEYPRQHAIGLDISGELWGIGLWAEAAAFFPFYTVVTDMQAVVGIGTLTEVDAELYVKAVVGLEYTFPGSVYLNLQYAHGFYHESTPGGLNDYLLLGLQWDLPGGLMTIGPIGAALEVDDFGNVVDSWALVLNPEIALHPMDNAELVVGARWIAGNDATTFGGQKAAGNAVYARATFSF